MVGVEAGEGEEEAGDGGVVFREAAAVDGVGEGSAEDGEDLDVRAVEGLEEEDLEFEGVFDGVAVVFEADGGGSGGEEAVDEVGAGAGAAEGGDEGLSGEAEGLGFTVVRGAEDEEGFVAEGGVEGAVGGAVGGPGAVGGGVRGGDADEIRGGLWGEA